jgi:hypothetical protein
LAPTSYRLIYYRALFWYRKLRYRRGETKLIDTYQRVVGGQKAAYHKHRKKSEKKGREEKK